MYWAVLITLCIGLQLPYQVVMQQVKMLSMVQLLNFLEDLRAQAKSFQPPDLPSIFPLLTKSFATFQT
jgi:hypothetical protein